MGWLKNVFGRDGQNSEVISAAIKHLAKEGSIVGTAYKEISYQDVVDYVEKSGFPITAVTNKPRGRWMEFTATIGSERFVVWLDCDFNGTGSVLTSRRETAPATLVLNRDYSELNLETFVSNFAKSKIKDSIAVVMYFKYTIFEGAFESLDKFKHASNEEKSKFVEFMNGLPDDKEGTGDFEAQLERLCTSALIHYLFVNSTPKGDYSPDMRPVNKAFDMIVDSGKILAS